jgi:hypothetical protein
MKPPTKTTIELWGLYGLFGTPKMLIYEYKKGQWRKQRKTREKMTESNTKQTGKIIIKHYKM